MTPNKKLDLKLIFVPAWVRQVQLMYKLPDSDLLSPARLLDILTLEDVSFYQSCNILFQSNAATEHIASTFTPYDLMEALKVQLSDQCPEVLERTLSQLTYNAQLHVDALNSSREYTNNMSNLFTMMSQPPSKVDLARLFLGTQMRDTYVFELWPITDSVCGIMFSKTQGSQSLIDSYKDAVALLCQKYPLEVVAQTAIFKQWVNSVKLA